MLKRPLLPLTRHRQGREHHGLQHRKHHDETGHDEPLRDVVGVIKKAHRHARRDAAFFGRKVTHNRLQVACRQLRGRGVAAVHHDLHGRGAARIKARRKVGRNHRHHKRVGFINRAPYLRSVGKRCHPLKNPARFNASYELGGKLSFRQITDRVRDALKVKTCDIPEENDVKNDGRHKNHAACAVL